ncbi:hypothetical protein [Poriferisphaera corsica]|nr:hypothetical protein [Poriferisphaera corsica]
MKTTFGFSNKVFLGCGLCFGLMILFWIMMNSLAPNWLDGYTTKQGNLPYLIAMLMTVLPLFVTNVTWFARLYIGNNSGGSSRSNLGEHVVHCSAMKKWIGVYDPKCLGIVVNLKCSTCHYNLRGLNIDSDCPECGRYIGDSIIALKRMIGRPPYEKLARMATMSFCIACLSIIGMFFFSNLLGVILFQADDDFIVYGSMFLIITAGVLTFMISLLFFFVSMISSIALRKRYERLIEDVMRV